MLSITDNDIKDYQSITKMKKSLLSFDRSLLNHLLFCITFCFFLFVSCNKEKDDPVDRTIIVYMTADAQLSENAAKNIKAMQGGYKEKGANLIVYIDDPVTSQRQIQRISNNNITVLKTYAESNSNYAYQLETVLKDVIGMYPSESYGLVLWSHGSSWLPTTKAFGTGDNRQMNISDLAAALPVWFDFILMDACVMGTVEVVYELRNKTDIIIASPTEVVDLGFPYKPIINELLKDKLDFEKVAKEYFDYYNKKEPGQNQSATISVIKTNELENLAAVTNQMLGNRKFNMRTFSRNIVQRFEKDYLSCNTYDFLDFLEKAFPDADFNPLKEQIEKTLLYRANTPRFFDEYDIETFCGLGSYIPNPDRNDYNFYYQKLDWCKASGFDILFQ